jgi:hypothetical protein
VPAGTSRSTTRFAPSWSRRWAATCLHYHRVRRTRNAGDYGETHGAVADDVLADHPGCQEIVGIAGRVISQMPPF